MTATRKISLATGVLFLITFVTSIPALLLFDPVINDAEYILGSGADNRIFLGATLELILILANIATALVLFPLLRRQNEVFALGFVAARIMECAFIAVGVLAVLAVVTVQQDFEGAGGTDSGALLVVSKALVAIKDWTFLFGPGFIVGVGNGFLLGYLMYRSGLMPRQLAALGLIGGPILCVSGIAVLFGVFDLGSAGQFIMSIPEILWELSIGIWLTVKGFSPSPIAAAYDRGVRQEAGSAPTAAASAFVP